MLMSVKFSLWPDFGGRRRNYGSLKIDEMM